MQSDWYAKVMSRREYLMLEDADLNWMTGSAEAAGSVTSKPAVLIENYPVDIPTARLWEAHGKLPHGHGVGRTRRRASCLLKWPSP